MGGILDNASLLGTGVAVLFIVLSVTDMIKSDAPSWVKPVVAIVFAPLTVFALLVYQGVTFTSQTWAGLALLSVFVIGSVLGIDYARVRRIVDQTRNTTLKEIAHKQAAMKGVAEGAHGKSNR